MVILTNIHKNCMGTISFEAKLEGMRKPQEFIVYPNPEPGRILVQSNNRCGIINADGKIRYAQCNTFAMLNYVTPKVDMIENFEALKTAIRQTASARAGTNGIIYTDNSAAANI